MMMRSDLRVDHTGCCQTPCTYWIITFNGKVNVWKCKLIFPTNTANYTNNCLNTIFVGETINVPKNFAQ